MRYLKTGEIGFVYNGYLFLLLVNFLKGRDAYDMQVDTRVVIIGMEKSFMISKDVLLPYLPKEERKGDDMQVTEEVKKEMVEYIIYARSLLASYSLPVDLSTSITEDYLSIRKTQQESSGTKLVTEDDFKRVLEIARGVCVSQGRTELERGDWLNALCKEKERYKRCGIEWWSFKGFDEGVEK